MDVHHSFLFSLAGVIMCNINSALGIEFNLLSFMGKLFKGKLNRRAQRWWWSRRRSSHTHHAAQGWPRHNRGGGEEHDNKSKNTFICCGEWNGILFKTHLKGDLIAVEYRIFNSSSSIPLQLSCPLQTHKTRNINHSGWVEVKWTGLDWSGKNIRLCPSYKDPVQVRKPLIYSYQLNNL